MAATSQISGNTHENDNEELEHYASTSTYIKIWIGIIVLMVFEVIIALQPLDSLLKTVLILGSSFIMAAGEVGYFMHLLFEKQRKFILTTVFILPLVCLVPLVIIVIIIPFVL